MKSSTSKAYLHNKLFVMELFRQLLTLCHSCGTNDSTDGVIVFIHGSAHLISSLDERLHTHHVHHNTQIFATVGLDNDEIADRGVGVSMCSKNETTTYSLESDLSHMNKRKAKHLISERMYRIIMAIKEKAYQINISSGCRGRRSCTVRHGGH